MVTKSCLTAADQRALGNQGAADAAGDRRRRRRVFEVEPRAGQRRLGLLVACRGLVIFLLADGLDLEQRLEAVEGGGGGGKVGLGRGAVGLVGARVNAEQGRAGGDVGALGEQALLDHALDARPHLGAAHGEQAAGQVLGQRRRARCDGQHLDFGGRRCSARAAGSRPRGRLLVTLAAGSQQDCQRDQQESFHRLLRESSGRHARRMDSRWRRNCERGSISRRKQKRQPRLPFLRKQVLPLSAAACAACRSPPVGQWLPRARPARAHSRSRNRGSPSPPRPASWLRAPWPGRGRHRGSRCRPAR